VKRLKRGIDTLLAEAKGSVRGIEATEAVKLLCDPGWLIVGSSTSVMPGNVRGTASFPTASIVRGAWSNSGSTPTAPISSNSSARRRTCCFTALRTGDRC
jgi:hypothetical protein